ncbi:DUF11 domain-containing protein [Paenibacillus sp. 481]|nr:DUF11 domain-containing protein [Paenibacillus sp. 481]
MSRNKKSKAAADADVSTEATTLAVDSPTVELNKSVNKTEAKVKELLTYTILVTNTGLVDAQNAILNDLLPAQLKFVPGSVLVDGVVQPNAHVHSGVLLGTVRTSQLIEVTFLAKVVNIPPDELVKNKATLAYQFQTASGSPVTVGEATSNETKTKIIVRPPTNCEKSRDTIEWTIKQEEKAVQELLAAEAAKTRAANAALLSGKITSAEQQVIVQSEQRTALALSALTQELGNKRNTIQDLCSGCK